MKTECSFGGEDVASVLEIFQLRTQIRNPSAVATFDMISPTTDTLYSIEEYGRHIDPRGGGTLAKSPHKSEPS